MRSVIAIGLLAVVCLVVAVEAEAQSHPIIGVWDLNLERSSFAQMAQPEAQKRSYIEGENGFMYFTMLSVGDGVMQFQESAFKTDGQPYTIWGGGNGAHFDATGERPTLVGRWNAVDANTLELRNENPVGEPVPGALRTYSVSADGQTLTYTFNENTLVFDRVE